MSPEWQWLKDKEGIEQRKVQGPEQGLQVEQTALLASPIYIGHAQGEEKKHIKRGAKGLALPLGPPPHALSCDNTEGFNVHHSKSLL